VTSGQCGKLQSSEKILPLEVGIVIQNVINGHPRSEEVQEIGDWVSQPADDRLAVADSRVGGDPVKTRHVTSVPVWLKDTARRGTACGRGDVRRRYHHFCGPSRRHFCRSAARSAAPRGGSRQRCQRTGPSGTLGCGGAYTPVRPGPGIHRLKRAGSNGES
jgi:hypothetical protein